MLGPYETKRQPFGYTTKIEHMQRTIVVFMPMFKTATEKRSKRSEDLQHIEQYNADNSISPARAHILEVGLNITEHRERRESRLSVLLGPQVGVW
jgi:hypothetical protein